MKDTNNITYDQSYQYQYGEKILKNYQIQENTQRHLLG